MKQVMQDLSGGRTYLELSPCPKVSSLSILVQTSNTLVSVGTEKMLLDFGRGNILQKALQQPDKVKQVLEKVSTDGLVSTVDAVRSKLDTPIPLGYCNVGTIVEMGEKAHGFKVGDRVVSNGNHAEFVTTTENLTAKIPDNVSNESASFTVIGAIALQGIRLLNPTLGECIVVTGLGLVGLLAVQLLKAQGCRVLAVDFDQNKLDLAKSFGAEIVNLSKGESLLNAAMIFSRQNGVDGVLITASTKSNEPLSQAARISRKRGRIVLVGVVGLEVSRDDFYEKELSFQVSCSYGPGRYDESYEKFGNDYPIGYVRWTEKRNFEAILDLLASGHISTEKLVTHQFKLDEVEQAYELVSQGNQLGILLQYNSDAEEHAVTEIAIECDKASDVCATSSSLGFIGAGNYARAVLLPCFSKTEAKLSAISSNSGITAVSLAKKFNVSLATSDYEKILASDVGAVVISTQHNSHAAIALSSIEHKKHVFLEKPLALNHVDIDLIEQALSTKNTIFTVGFNRRYSPHAIKMKSLLQSVNTPKTFIYTINAGHIPSDHWVQNEAVGGGRLVGECCHFIDLVRFLCGHKVVSYSINNMKAECSDSFSVSLSFEDGSIGLINYISVGGKSYPKEKLEVFCAGSVLLLNNFRMLTGYNWPGFKKMRTLRQDKGQRQCAQAFVSAIKTLDNSMLPPVDEILEVSRICLDLSMAR
ncbi:L-threonine 3-dehydrogenase [Sinobacterium norvegicum]|uniref:L-threonine 3-dehydrogenase n=1 Tax=Sinobacterium norvegicum TaxID=1641715 RepID=A0ABN8ELR4_9GAMM|nr:bi-domain-containing oxidoreductase [Sinobacterium norvegicum]CAH0993314.1 L-threonine 3-dehydrogenase [Sinobacterium norvegicum]